MRHDLKLLVLEEKTTGGSEMAIANWPRFILLTSEILIN